MPKLVDSFALNFALANIGSNIKTGIPIGTPPAAAGIGNVYFPSQTITISPLKTLTPSLIKIKQISYNEDIQNTYQGIVTISANFASYSTQKIGCLSFAGVSMSDSPQGVSYVLSTDNCIVVDNVLSNSITLNFNGFCYFSGNTIGDAGTIVNTYVSLFCEVYD